MTGSGSNGWPTAELDAVRRLHVIASAAGRHAAFAERRFDVSLDRLWSVAPDLASELPLVLGGLRGFSITRSEGERLTGEAVGALGFREQVDIVLRPGWCLMQGKVLTSGMAAAADRDGCRFAFFTSLRLPGGDLVDGSGGRR
ncbi:hypothetical protein ACIGXF_27325 [Streptomyces sp. NPDC053086]|uniref:hypothetical protein n=1 Tax=unclassified Streptomyces TaxID=2593676 RepID=UPI0037D54594